MCSFRQASEQQAHAEIKQSVASLEASIAAYESRLCASENATEIALDTVKTRAETGLVELAAALQVTLS